MGSFWNIFGKDGDETVTGAPAHGPHDAQASGEPAGVGQPQQESVRPAPPQLPAKSMPPRYGIDDAIKLMRTLPVDDNAELVVRVIKQTLASLSVHVADIIADATNRQETIVTTIHEYERAIKQFEHEIDARRHEIVRLQQELAETTSVRERLQLAEAAQTGAPPRANFAPPANVPAPSAPPPHAAAPQVPAPKRVEPPPIPMSAPRSVPPASFRAKPNDSKAPPPLPSSHRPLDPKTRADLAKTVDNRADSDKPPVPASSGTDKEIET